MEEKEKKMDGKKAKINNWIENILVFVVIPLVLFLLFLSPSVNMKSNKGNLLLGSWKKGTEKLDFYADGTYSLNNKKGKVERKSKKEINLTAHGLFTLKEKENRLEFTDKSGKVFKWDRDNLSYPKLWYKHYCLPKINLLHSIFPVHQLYLKLLSCFLQNTFRWDYHFCCNTNNLF